MQHINQVLKKIFPQAPLSVERVAEGVSTRVYRIIFPRETFYLRVLPEAGASFAPEVAAHKRLGQMGVKVPEVIYFEHYNEKLQRSIMVIREIKGQPISQSAALSQAELKELLREAGLDLACINSLPVEGFGWVRRESSDASYLRAEHFTQRAFALEYWREDVAYLAEQVLQASEVVCLERVLSLHASWLTSEQGYLVHGDFDTTQVYQDDGQYTGIIDFGEIRGADKWYDLGHFHMRDGELQPFHLLPALVDGYKEVVPLPSDHEQRIRFAVLLINVRALARSLQKRPTDRYTNHQLQVLREDLGILLS